MQFAYWLKSLTGVAQRSRRRGLAQVSNCRSQISNFKSEIANLKSVEQLEERTLPSASVLLIAGSELNISLEGGDDVRVRPFGGNVLVEIGSNGGILTPVTSLGTVPTTSIQTIVVSGGDQDNSIDLAQVVALSFPNVTSIQVRGHQGDDAIIGSADLANQLFGEDGSDTITAGAGNDTLDGGNGGDSLTSGGGNDSVLGGDGSDVIAAGDGNDTIDAGNGQDTVSAGNGDDSVFAGNGEDSVLGDAGNDTLNGDGGIDTVQGGDGNDSILGGEFADSLLGGNGNDTLDGQAGNDTLDSQAGNDSLLGGVGNDSMLGGDGDDFANGNGGNDIVSGNNGNDIVQGGSGDDRLNGDAGSDTMNGQGGNDSLFGGAGADVLRGGDGNDLVVSGLPSMAINDVSVAEGNSGTTLLQFTVSLSTSNVSSVSVSFVTTDGSAVAGSDYAATSGTLTFAPGTVSQTISISVLGDTALETDETLFVTLSNSIGADVQNAVGQATIINDDFAPAQTLFAVNTVLGTPNVQSLHSIDPLTAVATLIGPTVNIVGGLTSDPTGKLYADQNSDLYTVDKVTGMATLQFNFGAGGIDEGDIAYDSTTNQIYGIDFADSDLVRIDPIAMTGTNLGPVIVNGVTANNGIDWDGLSYRGSTLYGYVGGRGGNTGLAEHLYTIDTTTRVVTDVGPLGVPVGAAGGLAYDPNLDVFYLMTRLSGNLYRVNPNTGAATLIGNTGLGTVVALNYTLSGALPPPVVVPPPTAPVFTASNDTLFGDDGNDTLIGSLGNDLLNGGADSDSLSGGGGNDSMLGGAGQDTLDGQEGDDTLDGQGGNDTLVGGVGEDTFVLEPIAGGADSANGGDGFNTIQVTGTALADTITVSQLGGVLMVGIGGGSISATANIQCVLVDGANGNDLVTVGNIDTMVGLKLDVRGGTGNDLLNATGANIGRVRMSLSGNTGNDTINGSLGGDTIDGGSGDDLLIGNAGNDTMIGGAGDDTMGGGLGNDSINGGDGADSINGQQGDDRVDGGVGNDILKGADGNDTLLGGAGNDNLNGMDGNDSILSGVGADMVAGGLGDDTLDGGLNDDTINGQEGNDKIRGSDGNDSITGGDGNDTINGGDGNDTIQSGLGDDAVNGSGGDDVINADAGFDTVIGGDGSDILLGGADGDILLGEDGNDTINGQGGTDIVAGNQGVDVISDDPSEINEQFVLSLAQRLVLEAL